VGALSQLRVAAAAHQESTAPRPARPSETGQAVAVSALLTGAWHLVTPLGRPGRDAVYALRIAADPRAVRSPCNYRVLLAASLLARRHLNLGAGNLGSTRYPYEHRVANGNAWPWVANTFVDVGDGQLTLNHPGPSLAFTVILMTHTALALWWPRLPVRHG
jgi:hypothetical protein